MARLRSPADLAARVALVRKRLDDCEADALLVTNPRDVRYLTGFVGDDSWALIRARSAQPLILSDFRFDEQIQREAPHARRVIRRKGLIDELARLVRQGRWRRVAIQPDHVSVALRKRIARAIGARTLLDRTDELVQQRAVKDRGEIERIRRSLKIQQAAFCQTLAFMKPGRTEAEVAAYLEYRMRSLGADGTSFPSIVAVDANAALPHAVPGSARLRRGGIVLVDWGARYGGYCSDLTRTLGLGSMPRRIREVYAIVLDAQLAAIEAIAPGKKLIEVDAVARSIIQKAGYGKQFGHGLGHGIGLDIHEQPTLSPRADAGAVLEPGHVVTVEPGIYLPGIGGVRIEDDVLVTAGGHEVLSDLPKSLESAII